MSQSTLSRQLAALERDLGAQLLVREARGVRLTDAGRIVYSRAAALLDQFQQLGETLAAERDRVPAIRLGVPPGAPSKWLADQLARLAGFTFIVNDFTTNEQHDLMADGQLDIALTHDRSLDAASHVLLVQPLGLAVPDDSILHEKVDAEGFVPVRWLHGMRIMAHSQAAIRSSEGALRSLANEAGAEINWIFRRFSQHADLIAKLSQADGAITIPTSGLAQLPGWSWLPLTHHSQRAEDLSIRTWINWKPGQSSSVDACAQEFIDNSALDVSVSASSRE